jgi:hypothetical protein
VRRRGRVDPTPDEEEASAAIGEEIQAEAIAREQRKITREAHTGADSPA